MCLQAAGATAGIHVKADSAWGSGTGLPSILLPTQQPLPRSPVNKHEPRSTTSRVSQSVAAAAWPSLSRPSVNAVVTSQPVLGAPPTFGSTMGPPPKAFVKKMDSGSHVAQSAAHHRRAGSSASGALLIVPQVGSGAPILLQCPCCHHAEPLTFLHAVQQLHPGSQNTVNAGVEQKSSWYCYKSSSLVCR